MGAVALIVEGRLRANGGLSPGAYVLALAAAAPLAWRTRTPLAALVGVEAGALLCAVAFDASWAATGMVIVELSLVAINVRAGVALDLDDSQDPSGALRDIKQVSATALHDLRATLGVLRDQADAGPTAPASDLDALAGLADRTRSAELHTDVDVQVNGVVVPSAIGGAAFRIVQEGLTNVLRHADASSARVGIRARSDTLDIEITDDGHSDTAGVSPGLGLRGMAERAAALGGRLDVGPRAEGGWRVHAVLPLGGGNRS